MEENDSQAILKLVDDCSAILSNMDPFRGVQEIEAKIGNPDSTRAILALIAIHHKEHSDFLFNYLRVGAHLKLSKDKTFIAHAERYRSFRDLILAKVELIVMSTFQNNFEQAEDAFATLLEIVEEERHKANVPGSRASGTNSSIEMKIKAIQRQLNRLSDFIHIKHQDKLLTEMASLQKSMLEMEREVQTFIVNNF